MALDITRLSITIKQTQHSTNITTLSIECTYHKDYTRHNYFQLNNKTNATLRITTLSIKTFSIMTLGVTTLSTNNTQNNNTWYILSLCSQALCCVCYGWVLLCWVLWRSHLLLKEKIIMCKTLCTHIDNHGRIYHLAVMPKQRLHNMNKMLEKRWYHIHNTSFSS